MVTEKRYRVTVICDVWIPDTGDALADRAKAQDVVEGMIRGLPNSFVGEIDPWDELMDKAVGVKKHET